jgi:hypothetical protein
MFLGLLGLRLVEAAKPQPLSCNMLQFRVFRSAAAAAAQAQ